MNCQSHPHRQIQHKCITCGIFMCSQCQQKHKKQTKGDNHRQATLTQICEYTKQQLKKQVSKISHRINELNSLGDYEFGQSLIQACQKQIIQFVHQFFNKMKQDYRKICDASWNVENLQQLKQLDNKKSKLKGWRQIIKTQPHKIIDFQNEQIYYNNKIESDEEFNEESGSFLCTDQAPKICFNEFSLYRLNQLMGKVIYISQNYPLKPRKSKKKTLRKTSSVRSYKSILQSQSPSNFCRFLQGTNVLYEWIRSDNESDLNEHKLLRKIQFRQFACPMRSVSISVGGDLYLVGGETLKQKKMSRQIWFYERQYNTMRIICLMKKGRVSHCVCSYKSATQDCIFVYGGKQANSLQKIDLKKKTSIQIGFYQKQILGASMIVFKEKIYIFGGLNGPSSMNPNIIRFDLDKKQFLEDRIPLNYDEFKLPISPLLQILPLSPNSSQIVIIGGYYQYQKISYSNSNLLVYNVDYNYITQLAKSEIIYPILSNGNAQSLYYAQKENKIMGMVDLKRNIHKHGPNYGVLFEYSLKDGKGGIQLLGF